MDSVINALQKSTKYTVTEIGEDGEHNFDIDHYRALNSKYEEDKVIEEIATADTVTCAVGPNILKFIAPVIAKGIEARKLDYPLAVIACENAINATNTLRDFIFAKMSEDVVKNIDKHARFANSAIDRIVPHQDPNAGLNVRIEKFFEWCVESVPFKGAKQPDIKGVHFVENLEPYIERKLFTVNTGHATAAYYGHQRKIALIHDALIDKEVHDIVRAVLKETGQLIIDKHEIDADEQQEYIHKIVARFSNDALEDKVERVGRAPLRKLSRKERFIGVAAQLAERGESVDALLGAVEQAFRFQNIEGDEESAELAKIMKEHSAKEVVSKVCGLEESHPLYERVVKVVEKVQKQ
jgi:mannitol-1-phosphate 5-dehydrogenase